MSDTSTAIADTSPKPDGRNARKEVSRQGILNHARMMMAAGNFQPKVVDVAKACGWSVRTVFAHFPTVERLRMEALDHPGTRCMMLVMIVGDEALKFDTPDHDEPAFDRILYAAVFGRVAP